MFISTTMLQSAVAVHGRRKQWLDTWRRLKRNHLALTGLVIFALIMISALFAPLIAVHDPVKMDLTGRELKFGSPEHIMGTDEKGRDIFSRILYGSRISLLVGFSSLGLAVIFGVTLGLTAGYYRGLDGPIMRLMDLMFAFPSILLPLLIVAILGPSLMNMIIAIGIFSIPALARIVRGSVLSVKEMDYITAVRSMGAGDFRIIFGHILPNVLAPIIVYCTLRLGRVIISTAALSYLGLGAQPPTPEWGAMIASGKNYIFTSPHIAIAPGIAIILTVFSCNVLGDGLRDALDPNLKQSGG